MFKVITTVTKLSTSTALSIVQRRAGVIKAGRSSLSSEGWRYLQRSVYSRISQRSVITTSKTKTKHPKIFLRRDLFDLIIASYNDAEHTYPFDLIHQCCLNTNKDDNNRLKAALTYQGGYGNNTPLHAILFTSVGFKSPPVDIIQMMIKYAPEVLEMKNINGWLPIHSACIDGASLEVVQCLLTASPSTIKVEDNDGRIPLHHACNRYGDVYLLDVLNFLIESYPEGIHCKDKYGETPLDYFADHKLHERKDDKGMLALHHACKNGYSDHLIRFLIQVYPESINIKDNRRRTPLDYYTSFQGRQPCNEVIALLQPVKKRKREIQVNPPSPVPIPAHNDEAPPVVPIENR